MSSRLALAPLSELASPSPEVGPADVDAEPVLAHEDDLPAHAPRTNTNTPHHTATAPQPTANAPAKSWVDPAALPAHAHATPVGGSAPAWVKALSYNTLMHYGVGPADAFGARVGRALRFTDVSVRPGAGAGGRLEATTTAEVAVTKHMLNGAGMLHGGCVAYLIDNCCSTPLVVLGLSTGTNGVGVTQALNILFHAPAPLGTTLQIVSTSIALGGRVMSARCEILDKDSGRTIASAFLSKMQPAKL
ncbi:hypothetical protein HYPSUDRAFT_45020 [Hypholoma sublateritium FD-334 SS-4]|uniref:Thioesterase domain-containing protein n=1 Tax=Hypholoma sublateritium (strain FD-334 SS-4) TaxID=945553 RepID=A0A0D2KVP2_HYPSF|nr:hypothetical protein HYPSUDRAFT_45020 [Hypholoma sublateritium FD-334 SS-4]